MNPLRVSATNYRSFEHVDVEFPAGCVAIVGENGAGKSSIVNLVDLCLFGPQSRSLSEFYSDSAVDEDMVLGLEFQHGVDTDIYRVRRTYSARGRGSSKLDFEKYNVELDIATGQSEWIPLTREDQKATQQLIEQTIGLSRETFRASAFLAQGDGAAFTEAQPRDRKAILGEVLGLGVWDSLLALARAERAGVESEAAKLQTQIEDGERDLEQRARVAENAELASKAVAETSGALEKAEADHRSATENLNASREHAAALSAAKTVLEARERELQQLTERRATIQQALAGADEIPAQREQAQALAERKPEIEASLNAAREAESARAEHRRLTADRDRLVDDANKLRNHEAEAYGKATELEHEVVNECDRCHQPLKAEARASAIRSLKDEAREYHTKAKELESQADTLLQAIELTAEGSARGPNAADQATLEAQLRAATEAERTLAGLDEREKRVEELSIELAQIGNSIGGVEVVVGEAREAFATLEADAPSEDLEALVARAYSNLAERRADTEAAKQRLAVAQAELDRLSTIAAQTEARKADLGRLQGDLDLLHLAERAYGPNGVPALILENAAIPQIEAEADRILAELGTDYRVELRTQREKKTGGISDTLDIVILAPAGARLYESLSGGERSRVNVALRVALAGLLAHRRGAESRVLVLDEVEYLDEPGQERLAAVLQGLAGDFDTVILVSHVPGLRDVFDTTIQVVKEDGRSLIVGDREMAEVAA